MDSGCNNQKGLPNNIKKQLAFALRRIQWSYAIFWSISSTNPGVLEWMEGHYNGDVKTRKTTQPAEVVVDDDDDDDQMGFQRSEQLRELYESFKPGGSTLQHVSRRPSAALSPEDLTETEWYYLVCMSFTFSIDQDLPGRAYTTNQTIWLCNAHQAKSKEFSRALLAKGASIQTVVCFPYLGGVIELGVTEEVLEDSNLIQHIKSSFLEIPHPSVDKISSYVSDDGINDKDFSITSFDHALLETDLGPLFEGEDLLICSPDNSSNDFRTNRQAYMIEGINVEATQLQSWNILDTKFGYHDHSTMNSSDSLSQTYAENISFISNGERAKGGYLRDIQLCGKKEMNSFDHQGQNIHYQSIVSILLKSSHQLFPELYFRKDNRKSSFTSWKKEVLGNAQKPRIGSPQRILKKVLFEVAKMHGGFLNESSKDNGIREPIGLQEVDEKDKKLFSRKKRKDEINDRIMILSSLVPNNCKIDKISILEDTIEYLKGLERRINKLESQKEVAPKTRNKTFNKHSNNRTDSDVTVKAQSTKRKACNMDDMKPLNSQHPLREISTDEVSVSVIDKDITIEMNFPWRDGVLLEIMESMSNLHLDSHAIQATNSEGILSVSIKSKLKRSKKSSAGTIREALHRVIWNHQRSPPHQFNS